MISLSRPFFTPVAILLRQGSGGFVVGFLAFTQTMLWFAGLTLFLLFLRGFAHDTWIGGLLDIPIAPPIAVLAGMTAVVWLLRTTGIWSPQGPLRDHDALTGFTGRAARIWARLGWTRREWTVLETYESLLLSLSGVVLLLFPWTRIAGVMLLVMAAACAYQTICDRLWDSHREPESLDDFIAGVLSADPDEVVEYDDRPHVPDSPYADLPDDVVGLLDDDAKDAVEQARAESSPPTRTPVNRKARKRRPIEMTPRGPTSHRPGSTLALLFYAALGLGLFLVAVDPSDFYERSPERCRAGILSVQNGAARLGLASPMGREGPGGLATVVLDRVAPDDLGKLRRDANRREENRILDSVRETERAVLALRAMVEDRLGFELDVSSTTPQFDELVLEHDSVAEAWVALLNGDAGYMKKTANARERVDAIWLHDGVDVDAYDALFDEAEPWSEEVEALVVHVDHIASMLKAKRFEEALDQSPGDSP